MKDITHLEFRDIEDSLFEQNTGKDKILNQHMEFRQVFIT